MFKSMFSTMSTFIEVDGLKQVCSFFFFPTQDAEKILLPSDHFNVKTFLLFEDVKVKMERAHFKMTHLLMQNLSYIFT